MKVDAIAPKGRAGRAEACARFRLPITAASIVVSALLAATAAAPWLSDATASGGCPNEAIRGREGATSLPACRAYELASAPDKEGQEVVTTPTFGAEFLPRASLGGGAVAFTTTGAYGDPTANGLVNTYRAMRGAGGWTDEQIAPPLAPVPFLASSFFEGFTPDLEKAAVVGGWEPPLTPDASAGTGNLYLRDNRDGSYRLLSPGAPPELGEVGFDVLGVSSAAEHVVFESPIALTGPCGGPASEALCDWSAATGELERVGVRPGGDLSAGGVTPAGPGWQRPISADGSRIFFHEAGGECGVCVRIEAADTRLLSEGGTFWGASEDGSRAFVVEGGELERYDEGGSGESVPLTAGGEVEGVLGVAADGSRAYFVGTGVLAPGATVGRENLYLWTQGLGVELVATASADGAFARTFSRNQPPTARITPDGAHLAFTADRGIVGFPDEGKPEIYLYRASDARLACASCAPGGGPATSGASLEGASWKGHLSRNLSEDGSRLFFSTGEALAPGDVNGIVDTYEYDAAAGRAALVSSGRGEPFASSPGGSPFADASADGADVFFVTRQQLVGIDRDEAADVYDARAGGGFEGQNPEPPPPPCTGDDCRTSAVPPDLLPPASATFAGPGPDRKGCASLRRRADLAGRRAASLRRRARALAIAASKVEAGSARKLERRSRRLARAARHSDRRARRLASSSRRCGRIHGGRG